MRRRRRNAETATLLPDPPAVVAGELFERSVWHHSNRVMCQLRLVSRSVASSFRVAHDATLMGSFLF